MPIRNDFAPGEFCWIDLTAHDMQAAIAWYADLFGWTCHEMETPGGGPPYGFFMKGEGAAGGVGQMSDEMKAQGIPPTWNNYIATDDCEATEAKVKELGGTVTVPTMEVPGHGKLAFFMDPEGASFAAWQAATDKGGPGMHVNEPGGLCWNELMNRDTAKSTEFYGKLVGWEFADVPMGHVKYKLLKRDGADAGGMMMMEGKDFEGVPPYWLTYFAVADCEAAAAKVAATGGKVIVPPMEIAVGSFSVLNDPQGAVFAVIELKDKPDC